MTRTLLFLLFFVMLAADTLQLNLSLAPGISVKNAFIYLIFVIIATEVALKRNRRIELIPVIAPYTLCVIYAIFTWFVLTTVVRYPGYEVVTGLISLKSNLADNLIVLLIFFYGVLKTEDTISLLKMMLWTILIANVITVIDGINIPDLGIIHERENGRIGGPIGEANQYAAILALFLPPLLALAMIQRGPARLIAFAGFAASVLAFMMTVSRGGYVGLLLGLACAAWYLRQQVTASMVVRSVVAGMVLLFFGCLGLYFGGYWDLFYERVVFLSAGGSGFETSSGRTAIWGSALEVMLRNPLTLLTGFGWFSYDELREMSFAPHNTYLKIFFELGAIGLLLVLASFAAILRAAKFAMQRANPDEAKLLAGFIVGFISIAIAIFFVDLTTPWILFWAFTGVAMRLAVLQIEPAIAAARVRRPTTIVRSRSTQ